MQRINGGLPEGRGWSRMDATEVKRMKRYKPPALKRVTGYKIQHKEYSQ